MIGNRRRLIKAAIAVAVFLAVSFRWDVGTGFLVGLLVASVGGLIDGRASVAAALLCLVCCPILLWAEQDAWLQQSPLINYYVASAGLIDLSGVADQIAVWAYYLLCIGVAALIVQQIREGRSHDGARTPG